MLHPVDGPAELPARFYHLELHERRLWIWLVYCIVEHSNDRLYGQTRILVETEDIVSESVHKKLAICCMCRLTAPEQLSSGVSAQDIHANVSSAVADAVSGVESDMVRQVSNM
ncbi:Dol-P-Man:Man(5)GlcNAc(2)-PP-Dol alpha-1,3-mannosyltransferase [Fusarium oxysporum f. sp. albedinis]|nr:Dol-P-Man:Man(5)GlcNAc(2)-PP-Dol alpha-1,3-mannosyltransferase [Fusarium oxysporum f. sp. albedinis]